MSGDPAHPKQPTEEEIENSSSIDNIKQPKSQEEIWAEQLQAYREGSSQNQGAVELYIGLASMGIKYCTEVIQAYHFLKKPLDPKKLLEDLSYKKQVERAIQLVKRHGGSKKYEVEIKRTETALGQVNTIHNEQIKIKTSATNQYQANFKSVYGLNDEQIKTTVSHATQRIKENPTLSMHDALQLEARETIKTKIEQSAKKETDFKKLSKKEKREEIERRIQAKEREFKDNTTTAQLYENGRCSTLRQEGKQQIAQTLEVQLNPQAKKWELRYQTSTQSITQLSQQPPVQQTSQPVQQPETVQQPQISPQPISASRPAPRQQPTLPHVPSTPQVSFLNNTIDKIKTSFANSRLGTLFSGSGTLGRLFSFGNKFLGGDFIKSGLTKFGGTLLKQGLTKLGLAAGALSGLATMGITTAVTIGASLLNKLSGGRLGQAFQMSISVIAMLFIGGGILIFLLISGTFSSSEFAHMVDPYAKSVSVAKKTNGKTISWLEFEKTYLTNAQKSREVELSEWESFEQEHLLPQKTFLSTLNADRHDDVQE